MTHLLKLKMLKQKQFQIRGMEDEFKILIATDNHLGYLEKDPVRGSDSFDAFEEILQLAVRQEVDFIVLGGDLFHDSKPSQRTFHTTLGLLRQYCLGDKPCTVELLSNQDQSIGSNKFANVNYEDPNINVAYPVFSIHGNHDDPTGGGNLCALELLAVTGLVNYFGKQTDLENVEVKPILMRKGSSFLALYGLGNIRDERLNRLFRDNRVRLFRPVEDQDDWFSLFVLHQNRIAHSSTNCIQEQYLNRFLDLVLWGHEHECRIDLEHNLQKGFHVTQPGSSVATSLCEAEAREKHVGILYVRDKQFRIEKHRLKTVRPFVMREVSLSSVAGLSPKDHVSVSDYLQSRVTEMIEEATDQWLALNGEKHDAPKPLVRLKVEYSGGFSSFNPQRFGQHFVDLVANPKDILCFYRKRQTAKRAIDAQNAVKVTQPMLPDALDECSIEELVMQFLRAQTLSVLPENELCNALYNHAEKNDKDAIKTFVQKTVADTKKTIMSKLVRKTVIPVAKQQTRRPATRQTLVAAADSEEEDAPAIVLSDDSADIQEEEEEENDELDVEDADQLSKEITRLKQTRMDTFDNQAVSATKNSNKPSKRTTKASTNPDFVETTQRYDPNGPDSFSDISDEAPKPTAKRGATTKRTSTTRATSSRSKRAKPAPVEEDFDSVNEEDVQVLDADDNVPHTTTRQSKSRASTTTTSRRGRSSGVKATTSTRANAKKQPVIETINLIDEVDSDDMQLDGGDSGHVVKSRELRHGGHILSTRSRDGGATSSESKGVTLVENSQTEGVSQFRYKKRVN